MSVRGVGAVVAFFLLSPILTGLNKYSLQDAEWLDNFVLVFIQQLASFLVNVLVDFLLEGKLPRARKEATGPAILFVLQLGLTNVCLSRASLPVYQAVRASALLFSVAAEKKRPPFPQTLCILAVASGFLLATAESKLHPHHHLLAVAAGVLGSAAGVAYMAQSRELLTRKKMRPIELVQSVSLLTSALLLPVALWRRVTPSWSLCVGAALSPLMPLCSAMALRELTPLSCTLLGLAKTTLQTALGAALWGPPLTAQVAFGVALCVVGSALYHQLPTEKDGKIQ